MPRRRRGSLRRLGPAHGPGGGFGRVADLLHFGDGHGRELVVGDGREAIERYGGALREGRRFDVVILDLTVPAGMGALDTLQWLRELDPAVRVLVSSGYADDPVLLNFRQHGFRGTVTKPYCLAELAKVLVDVLAGDPRKVAG